MPFDSNDHAVSILLRRPIIIHRLLGGGKGNVIIEGAYDLHKFIYTCINVKTPNS